MKVELLGGAGSIKFYATSTTSENTPAVTLYPTGVEEITIDYNFANPLQRIYTEVAGSNPAYNLYYVEIDGIRYVNSKEVGVLNFAPGTDMAFVEAGDIVQQESSVAVTWSDLLTDSGNFPHGAATQAFDGNLNFNDAALNLNGGGTFTLDLSSYPIRVGSTCKVYVGNNMICNGYTASGSNLWSEISPGQASTVHEITFPVAVEEIHSLTFYNSSAATASAVLKSTELCW